MEFSYGLMAANTRVNGKIIKLMGMASSSILMGTYMRDSGKMIRQMVVAPTLIPTEQVISENGKMTSNMDTVSRNGSMEKNTKESM